MVAVDVMMPDNVAVYYCVSVSKLFPFADVCHSYVQQLITRIRVLSGGSRQRLD